MSALAPRDEPSDELIEAVARAIASEDISLAAAFSNMGSINQQHREREIAFNMARAAIEAYQKATGGDPRGASAP